jgi:predicted PurR-regulated permease PerM
MALLTPGAGEPKKRESLDDRLKRVLLILGMMCIVVVGATTLKILMPAIEWTFSILSPFLFALILAYIFNPAVNFLQVKLKLGRAGSLIVLAAFLTIVLCCALGLLVIVIYQLGDAIITVSNSIKAAGEEGNLLKFLPEFAQNFLSRFMMETDQGFALDKQAIEEALNATGVTLQNLATRMAPSLGGGAGLIAGGIAAVVSAVFSFFSLVVFASMITFYFLLDFQHIPRVLRILIPDEKEDRAFHLLKKIDRAVGGFLRGQLLACICVAILASTFLMILGPRKWAILIGCIAGAVNFIPYLGPVFGAGPALIWSVFYYQAPLMLFGWEAPVGKPLHIALIIGAFALIQAIDGVVIQPKIVGKNANLHPLAVLLALLIGARFGVGGMIVAVPVACIVRVLIKELWWDALADQDARVNQE